MPDERHDVGEQRHRRTNDRIALKDALAGGGADCDALVLTAHEGKLAYAGDVDEPFRAREPHGHERHEALPAGDDSRVVAGGQHCASLGQIRRPCIFEWSGFHRASRPSLEVR